MCIITSSPVVHVCRDQFAGNHLIPTRIFMFFFSRSMQTAGLLVPNSTTRTPATDMLYTTTNGQAHNNSTTCCTTNSPLTNENLPHPNILTCRDVGLWHCDVANFCPLVVLYNASVAGVRVVEFGS